MKKLIDNFRERIEKRNKIKNRFFVISDEGWYFDSSKANLIAKYFKWQFNYELYLTDNGNWIEIKNRHYANKLNSKEARNILKELNKVKVYEKYFEKLDEA
ncbi:hypothetical protein P5F25_02520 [Clostridium perfringens]|nr:hypothetical protein [Clostridium perfringens]